MTRSAPTGSSRHRTAAAAPSSTGRGAASGSGPRGELKASEQGLVNARTRLVGDRTGFLADATVGTVRLGRGVAAAAVAGWRLVAAVVTPLGWTMLLTAVVGLIGGYLIGWAELVTVAWVAALLVLIALLYLLGATTHRAELFLPHTRVVAGQSAAGQVTVRNAAAGGLFGAVLEVPVGNGLVRLPLPTLLGTSAHEEVFLVPTSRRGVITVGPVRTVRGDPIGLLRRERVWAQSIDLYVHPATVSISSTSTGYLRDLEGRLTRELTDSDVSFHALREYQTGDDRRYIHWKSTAKQGVYMVRQFEQTRRSHLLVALSLSRADYADDDEFELAVSAAGSLGVRAIRDARTVSMLVSDETPEFAKRKVLAVRSLSTLSRLRLLDDLTRLELADNALGLVDLARVAAGRVGGMSVAFLLLGSTASASTLRSAAASFPEGVEVVAVVCEPGYVPSLRRVADLTVVNIGYLADLQKALAGATAA